ncbi:MAG: SixA phosphatase family protein [Actinomycetota bacterium]
MRYLYLLRHAKSSWNDPGLADRERPLAPRGRRAAGKIAGYLRSEKVSPTLVLCSPARRTMQTLELIAPALGEGRTLVEEALYLADATKLLKRLRRLPETVFSVMLIGHNPSLQELALTLAGRGAALGRLEAKFPTGALAILAVPAESWRDLGEGVAELAAYVVPRDLG